eukprot:4280676-Karenia_brevis.AAC.1
METPESIHKGKLEEKYIRRIDKYDGSIKGFREWIFNIEVAFGQIDRELAYMVRELIRRDDMQRFPDSWNPKEDHLIDKDVYDKYSGELYG